MKISAIIITKNEESNIESCIQSLGFVDEINLIDNGSTDKTVNIARNFKAKVYIYKGRDFSYLRNIGKEKSKYEWLLYIDADERVTDNLCKDILKELKYKSDYSAYKIIRENYYLGGSWPFKESIIRLIKKKSLVSWQGSLHETPIITGKIGQFYSEIKHYSHRSISEMVRKTDEWSEIEAHLRYKNNHPMITWWRIIRVMITSFFDSFIKQKAWKAGVRGLIESIYQSFSMFITYAKLWEKQNKYLLSEKDEASV